MFLPMYGGWDDRARVLWWLQLCLQWELESQTGTQTLRPHLLLSAFTSHQCDQGSPAHTLRHSGHVQGHPPLQGQSRHLARLTLQHSDQDQQVQRNDNTHYLVLCCSTLHKLTNWIGWLRLTVCRRNVLCCDTQCRCRVATKGNICLSLNQYIFDQRLKLDQILTWGGCKISRR